MSSNGTATMAEILVKSLKSFGVKVDPIDLTTTTGKKKDSGNHPVAAANRNTAAATQPPPQRLVFSFPTLAAFKPPPVPVIQRIDDSAAQKAANDAAIATFKEEIGGQISTAVHNIRTIRKADGDERALLAEAEVQTRKFIEWMNSLTGMAKTIAVTVYAGQMIRTCPEIKGALINTIGDLKDKGFIVESDRGLKAYGQFYRLGDDFRASHEARDVMSSIEDLVRRTAEAGRQRVQAEADGLSALADENNSMLSVADIKAGIAGRARLEVPTKKIGNEYHPGGWILVEVTDEMVCPLAGAGHIKRMVEEMAEAGVGFPVNQIGKDRLDLGERLERDNFNLLLTFFHMVNAAVAHAEKAADKVAGLNAWQQQLADEYAVLSAKATLSPDEFFLREMTGSAPFWFGPGEFSWKEDGETTAQYYGVMGLAERNDRGEVRIADYPERLKKLFVGCGEFTPAGESFRDCPNKLRVLLRRSYGIASENAASAAAEAAATQDLGQQIDPVSAGVTSADDLGRVEVVTITAPIAAATPAPKQVVANSSRYINPKRGELAAAIRAKLAAMSAQATK